MTTNNELIGFFDEASFSYRSEKVPDVSVTAGYVIESSERASLTSSILRLKRSYWNHDSIPVKWNLRDRKVIQSAKTVGLDKQDLFRDGDALRKDCLAVLQQHHATVFVSVITGHSYRDEKLKASRAPRIGYGFSNILMRVGQYVRYQCNTSGIQLVLDWPEGSDTKPYNDEYSTAWLQGVSADPNTPTEFFCGPLKDLGFHQSVLYGKTHRDADLQLADLVVGSSAYFVQNTLMPNRKLSLGEACFRDHVYPSLHRSSDGEVDGRGFIMSPSAGRITNALRTRISELERERMAEIVENLFAEPVRHTKNDEDLPF